MHRMVTAAVTAIFVTAMSANAAAASPAPAEAQVGAEKVCKYVVSAEKGSKPFQMCLTKAEWAAKEAQEAKDANRIVCRYEEVPGSKFKAKKVCQPASEWAEQRRMHREQVEDLQMRVCVPGAGC